MIQFPKNFNTSVLVILCMALTSTGWEGSWLRDLHQVHPEVLSVKIVVFIDVRRGYARLCQTLEDYNGSAVCWVTGNCSDIVLLLIILSTYPVCMLFCYPSRYICLSLISAVMLPEVRNTFQEPSVFTNFSSAWQFKIQFKIFPGNMRIKIAAANSA